MVVRVLRNGGVPGLILFLSGQFVYLFILLSVRGKFDETTLALYERRPS
jgi:hypothetical protein